MRRARRAANRLRLGAPPRVQVEIGELLLTGFAPAERYVIGDAFLQELEQALTEAEALRLFPQSADLPSLNAGRITLSPQPRPASVGAQAARAVFGGLRAGSRRP